MSAVTATRLHGRAERPSLDPAHQVEILVGAGYAMLAFLDHLGGRVLDALAARRLAALSKNHLSWTSKMVLSGVGILTVVFGWGVASNIGGENAWLTAGPAGAAQSAPVSAQETAARITTPSAVRPSTLTPTSKGTLTMSGSIHHSVRHVVLAGLTGATMMGGAAALAAPAGAAAVPASSHASAVVHRTLSIVTAKNGWPEFANSKNIVFPKNSTIVLTIKSNDDGAGALPKNVIFYDKVMGTVGSSETVDGKTVKAVKNADISHTFTVPMIGLNIPIPAAPKGKIITIRATFHTGKAGSYSWQCYAPCGTGANGEKGPMVAAGYMKGTVTIK